MGSNMAKATATKQTAPTEQTAMVAANDQLALAQLDNFDFGESDGLGEYDAKDLKLPLKIWNMKGTSEGGLRHQIDMFYDTITEQQTESLRLVFLYSKKLHEFAKFSKEKNETQRFCGSHDRVTGRLRLAHPSLALPAGTVRECETCPDREWRDVGDGKREQPCYDVHGVVALEVGSDNTPGQPCALRFRKTSLGPWMNHLRKHHLGKRKLPNGKFANRHLCSFVVTVSLEADKGGNFAVPVFGNVEPITSVFPPETIQSLAEQARFYQEASDDAMMAAERQETRHETPIETSGESELRASDFTG